MIRRHRVVALAVIAGLFLSACTDQDARRSDVVDAMRDAGLDREQADCVGDGFEEAFGDDQDLFNDVASAADEGDFPGDSRQTVNSILDQCVDGEGADEGGTTTTEGTGTTTTTTAGG
jgi:hypothetical protein